MHFAPSVLCFKLGVRAQTAAAEWSGDVSEYAHQGLVWTQMHFTACASRFVSPQTWLRICLAAAAASRNNHEITFNVTTANLHHGSSMHANVCMRVTGEGLTPCRADQYQQQPTNEGMACESSMQTSAGSINRQAGGRTHAASEAFMTPDMNSPRPCRFYEEQI